MTINYYSAPLINRLINSLAWNELINYQLIIVNNSPQDREIANLQNDRVNIIEADSNLGFGRACNLGLEFIYQQDSQAIVWLINPDAYFTSNYLEKIPGFFSQYSDISILGTTIYNPNGSVWFARGTFSRQSGVVVSTKISEINIKKDYFESDWVSGCSLLLNLKNFDYCPHFDINYFLYYEDFDFCYRYAQMGHKIAVSDRFPIIHESSSITNRNQINKIKHSTYSYLLTLHKYSSSKMFWMRFARLFFHALVILPFNSQVALGKIIGIYNYCRNGFIFTYDGKAEDRGQNVNLID